HTLLEQQASLLKTLKRRSELRRILLPDGLNQGIRKFAAEGCADLGHLSCWAQPIKSCHQRGVQACRNGDSWRRNATCSASSVTYGFRFQHRLGHFLHEQGTPSVRSMMSCLMVSGSALLPVTRSIIAMISRSPRRLRVRAVT